MPMIFISMYKVLINLLKLLPGRAGRTGLATHHEVQQRLRVEDEGRLGQAHGAQAVPAHEAVQRGLERRQVPAAAHHAERQVHAGVSGGPAGGATGKTVGQ